MPGPFAANNKARDTGQPSWIKAAIKGCHWGMGRKEGRRADSGKKKKQSRRRKKIRMGRTGRSTDLGMGMRN